MGSILSIVASVLKLGEGILGRIWKAKDNPELKKAADIQRDAEVIEDSTRIVTDAKKEGDLDELRRAAAE